MAESHSSTSTVTSPIAGATAAFVNTQHPHTHWFFRSLNDTGSLGTSPARPGSRDSHKQRTQLQSDAHTWWKSRWQEIATLLFVGWGTRISPLRRPSAATRKMRQCPFSHSIFNPDSLIECGTKAWGSKRHLPLSSHPVFHLHLPHGTCTRKTRVSAYTVTVHANHAFWHCRAASLSLPTQVLAHIRSHFQPAPPLDFASRHDILEDDHDITTHLYSQWSFHDIS